MSGFGSSYSEAPPAAGDSRDQGHMSMANGATLAADPSRSMSNQPQPIAPGYEPPQRDTSTLAAMHSAGVADSDIEGVRAWMDGPGPTQTAAELALIDAEDNTATSGELRSLWGSQYGDNLKAINKYLDNRLPPGMGDVLRHARKPDGRAYANDPAMLQRLLGLALKPQPKGGGDPDAEIRGIERMMREDRRSYDRDEQMQARLRELYALKAG